MKNNQKGFGAVELLLVLILISILGFTGYYVYHTRNNTNSTYNSAAKTSGNSSKSSSSTPSLADAISTTKTAYDAWEKDSTEGTKLQDNSEWASKNTLAALDLQLINKNKSWFTSDFLKKVNNYESTNTTPPSDGFLACESGIAYYHNGSLKVTGDKVSGNTAQVNVTYDVGFQSTTNVSIPVSLKVVDGAWAIDSIDLSGC